MKLSSIENPLVSVALCTYNGEKYLKEQLDSIINQTYKSLEIVVLDDCSIDNTPAIISEYAAKDKRIRFFQNEKNLGFNKNFEKALTLTSGEYIAISDQDDIWKPEKLNTLLNNIKDNWLIFSNSSYIGEKNGQLLTNYRLSGDYKDKLLHNHVTGHTVLLNRKLLDFAIPFPEDDFYDWWLGLVAAYHHKIAYLDQILTYHRVHSESVIQTGMAANKIDADRKQYYRTISMLESFAVYKNLKAEDKDFINKLSYAYKLRESHLVSFPLIGFIAKHYSELFPDFKPRKFLSRLNFAFKMSKRIKTA